MASGKIKLQAKVANVGSEEKIVTKQVRYSRIGGDLLVARIAQSANLHESNVRMAIGAITDAIKYFVLNGHTVNLGKFGYLGIAAQALCCAQASQVGNDLVKGLRLKYRPSSDIRENVLGNIQYQTESLI